MSEVACIVPRIRARKTEPHTGSSQVVGFPVEIYTEVYEDDDLSFYGKSRATVDETAAALKEEGLGRMAINFSQVTPTATIHCPTIQGHVMIMAHKDVIIAIVGAVERMNHAVL